MPGLLAALALLLLLLAPAITAAHPHVWIDYSVTVRFGPAGPDGVRVDWAFDEMMSSLLTQKYDTDRDGKFSAAETKLLEKEVVVHLKDFNYFMELRVGGADRPVTTIRDFEARVVRGVLHYAFTVPITGAPREGAVDVNVGDPTFYSAFAMTERPITFEGGAGYRIECGAVRDPKTNRPEGLRCTYRRQPR
jgi:nickel/cobalt exporter